MICLCIRFYRDYWFTFENVVMVKCACHFNGILSTTLTGISIVLFNQINNIYSNVGVSNAAESSSLLVYNNKLCDSQLLLLFIIYYFNSTDCLQGQVTSITLVKREGVVQRALNLLDIIIDGWMDGWMEGGMDGLMDEWVGGRPAGRRDRQTEHRPTLYLNEMRYI